MTMPAATASAPAVSAAISEWRSAIGAAYVSTAADDLRAAAGATFPTRATVFAIVRPADTREVQECVRIANKFTVPLYPVSTGRNWGYGSRSPVRDAVILDLGRLNKIIDLNEDLAYVTVEPGVTQRQL